MQIARNTARDLGRSRSRRRWEPLELENEPEALEPEAFDYVELADTAKQLNAALATLSPRDATALDLVVHIELSEAD